MDYDNIKIEVEYEITDKEDKFLCMLEKEKKTLQYQYDRLEWRIVNFNEGIFKDMREMFDTILVRLKNCYMSTEKNVEKFYDLDLRKRVDDLFLVDRSNIGNDIAYKNAFKSLKETKEKMELIDTIDKWIRSGNGTKENTLYIKSECCESHCNHYFPDLYDVDKNDLLYNNESIELCKNNIKNVHYMNKESILPNRYLDSRNSIDAASNYYNLM